MEPMQIALIVLVVAGVWALVELALVLRRTRTTVASLDKTVNDLNDTLAEARPIVAKLDGAMDEVQPALAEVKPLLKSTNQAVGALTSTLVEVEGVVRDVSAVSGAAASAGNTVSSISDNATQAVTNLFHKVQGKAPLAEEPERTLLSEVGEGEGTERDSSDESAPVTKQAYYTYGSASEASDE